MESDMTHHTPKDIDVLTRLKKKREIDAELFKEKAHSCRDLVTALIMHFRQLGLAEDEVMDAVSMTLDTLELLTRKDSNND